MHAAQLEFGRIDLRAWEQVRCHRQLTAHTPATLSVVVVVVVDTR